jgi:DNA-directed RNA polymerase specialized sigma24 family protein
MDEQGGPSAVGDRQEFAGELFDYHAEEVYRYVLGWTLDRSSALDLTAKVLRTAVDRRDQILDGADAAGLEMRVVALARAAVTRWQAASAGRETVPAVPEESMALFEALGELDDSQREVLILCELVGLDPERVGRLLGCDRSVVEELRHHASETLWRKLDGAPEAAAVSTWDRLTVGAALRRSGAEWLTPADGTALAYLREQLLGEAPVGVPAKAPQRGASRARPAVSTPARDRTDHANGGTGVAPAPATAGVTPAAPATAAGGPGAAAATAVAASAASAESTGGDQGAGGAATAGPPPRTKPSHAAGGSGRSKAAAVKAAAAAAAAKAGGPAAAVLSPPSAPSDPSIPMAPTPPPPPPPGPRTGPGGPPVTRDQGKRPAGPPRIGAPASSPSAAAAAAGAAGAAVAPTSGGPGQRGERPGQSGPQPKLQATQGGKVTQATKGGKGVADGQGAKVLKGDQASGAAAPDRKGIRERALALLGTGTRERWMALGVAALVAAGLGVAAALTIGGAVGSTPQCPGGSGCLVSTTLGGVAGGGVTPPVRTDRSGNTIPPTTIGGIGPAPGFPVYTVPGASTTTTTGPDGRVPTTVRGPGTTAKPPKTTRGGGGPTTVTTAPPTTEPPTTEPPTTDPPSTDPPTT